MTLFVFLAVPVVGLAWLMWFYLREYRQLQRGIAEAVRGLPEARDALVASAKARAEEDAKMV